MTGRPTFVDTAVATARVWSSRSEDLHQKVGACIINKEGRVLSVGYNGLAPKITKDNSFWQNREKRRDYVIHAEINALSLIKRQDSPFLIAVTLLPCKNCAINIACYGIKNVVYIDDYEKDQSAKDIFKFYEINLFKYS